MARYSLIRCTALRRSDQSELWSCLDPPFISHKGSGKLLVLLGLNISMKRTLYSCAIKAQVPFWRLSFLGVS